MVEHVLRMLKLRMYVYTVSIQHLLQHKGCSVRGPKSPGPAASQPSIWDGIHFNCEGGERR